MRILLIEDDTLIGDGLKTGLEKLGFSVDWFDDGDDGQEALFQAPYDAVVLDLGLPGRRRAGNFAALATERPKGTGSYSDGPRRCRPTYSRLKLRRGRLSRQAFLP